jgi:hypothetical protein
MTVVDEHPSALKPPPVFRPDRAVAIGWLVLMATLPIQWMQIASSSVGIVRWFHLGALAFVTLALASIPVRRCLRTVWRASGPFVLATSSWLVVLAAASHRHGQGLSSDAVQQGAYALIAFVVAAWFVRLLRDDDEGLWGWVLATGVVTLVSFLVIFDNSARDAGVNALDTAVRGITTGNTDLIEFDLFRRTFAEASTGETDARSNVRHEVFASLVVAMWVSVLAWSRCHLRAGRPVMLAVVAVTGLLTFISLSRATYLMVALVAVPLGLRALLNRWATRRETYLLVASTWLVLAATVTGLYVVLFNRLFEDSDSYEGRSDHLGEAVSAIADQFFVGHVGTPRAHNIVLDTWFRAGVAGGLAAAAMVVMVAVATFHFGRRVVVARQLDWADVALFSLGVVPLVRMFTAGGGTLHLTSWVALGVVGGAWAARHRTSTARPPAGAPAPAPPG